VDFKYSGKSVPFKFKGVRHVHTFFILARLSVPWSPRCQKLLAHSIWLSPLSFIPIQTKILNLFQFIQISVQFLIHQPRFGGVFFF